MAEGPAGHPTGASADDRRRLHQAIELSRRCPPSATAFSVGAVIVDAGGATLATGWSREHDPRDHAEEAALAKLGVAGGAGGAADPVRLAGATLYSSLEPCSRRASRPRTCSQLILAAGVPRVVFAWREPELFVDCHGAEDLRAAGVEVVEVPDLAELVRQVNAHLLGG
jgi:diaminohydroxyphosphoribosylaminopyrimidine deaminase/5-amino-6-(5-phosphoribosylamino)uracil reductase